MKKTIFCILLASILCSNITSCGGTSEEIETIVSAETVVTETEQETEIKPELPEKTFDGYVFRVLGTETDLSYMLSSEVTGEKLNDSIYQANLEVTEQFDVGFETVVSGDITLMKSNIMAGTDAHDLSYMHDCSTASAALEGLFLDINTLPYVDTQAEWWPSNTVDCMTINGKLYHYSNYTSYFSFAYTQAVFFNKGLMNDFHLEDPYELVRNNKWTIDKMVEMTTSLYQDANGNGTRDKDDVMGLAAFGESYRWPESFGIEVYSHDPSGGLALDVNNERVITIIEKLHNWFYGGEQGAWVNFTGVNADSQAIFTAGNAVFTFDTIGNLTPKILDTDVDFGIVPYPKADETQETYLAGCNDRLFAVPNIASNPERTGVIIEAMSYAGYKNILPAYVEYTLQSRYASDEECSKMLELIFENQVMSFSYLFANAVPDGMQFKIFMDTIPKNSFASWYSKNEKKELAFLEKLEAFYAD